MLRKVILLGLCVAVFAITYNERDFALGRPTFYCATLALRVVGKANVQNLRILSLLVQSKSRQKESTPQLHRCSSLGCNFFNGNFRTHRKRFKQAKIS